MSTEQVSWLRTELTAAPRPRWTVVFGHRPLWATNHGGNDIPAGNAVLQSLIEDVLDDAKVDLVIQGHIHDYERTYPMRKGVATATNYSSPAAPVYVVSGGAGNREGNDHPPGDQPWVPHPSPGTNALSFGLITLSPAALVWQQLFAGNATVFDSFTITK
jgi:3',5'-cyclic AMP phosphodiesterase CpdA